MNRDDLKKLAQLRFREARVLLTAGEFSGSYSLAGYAVECALKACIAKQTARFDFPEKERAVKSYSHRLVDLFVVARLSEEFSEALESDPALKSIWTVVRNWSEQSRYQIWTSQDAKDLLDAVRHGRKGILPWVTQRW
jgi:hypothetical protein